MNFLLHSGLSVYAMPTLSALLYGCLACTALPSLWQRSVSARSWADVMLLQPCRHTSRRADGQTDRRTDKTSEQARCIYSLFTYASLTARCMAWYSLKANQYWICRAYNVESPRLISARLCPKYFIKSKYDRMQWCGSDLNPRVIWKWCKKHNNTIKILYTIKSEKCSCFCSTWI